MNVPAIKKDSQKRVSVPAQQSNAGMKLVPQDAAQMFQYATMMAGAGSALPKHLRGNEGACLAVATQAFEWEMSPFAVANKSYLVNDRIAYEAQLISAVVNTRADIVQRPTITFDGEGPTRQCRVRMHFRDGSEPEYVTPMFKDITTKNSPLWKSDSDQQLAYFAVRSAARRYCPEVILGVYDREEIQHAEPVPRPQPNTLLQRLSQTPGQDGIPDALDADFEDVDGGEVAEESGEATSDAATLQDVQTSPDAPENGAEEHVSGAPQWDASLVPAFVQELAEQKTQADIEAVKAARSEWLNAAPPDHRQTFRSLIGSHLKRVEEGAFPPDVEAAEKGIAGACKWLEEHAL